MIGIEPRLDLGLKNELVYKSKKLEKIYFPLIIKMLKKHHRSDLDGMFFGITNIWYKKLQYFDSIKQIKSYMNFTREKYTQLQVNNDLYIEVAKMAYNDLSGSLKSVK